MSYFGELHPRTAAIRKRIMGTQPAVCTQRAVYTTQAYRAHEQDQVVLKRAYMVDAVLRNMSIFIDPDELIVGNHASANRAAPIFPEYAIDWVVAELDEFEKGMGTGSPLLKRINRYLETYTHTGRGAH